MSGTRCARRYQGSGICRVRVGQSRRLAAVRDRPGGPAGGGARQFAARVPDGRPQAAHCHRPRDAGGRAFLRLGSRRRRGARRARRPAGQAPASTVAAEPQTLADARRVTRLISFRDPAGNRLEAFYGAEIDDTPFSPGRSISGFRTGPLGLGHAVLTVENIDADDAVLCRPARLRAFRLHRKAVSRLFLPRQRTPSLPRADRDRQATACII